jgi:2-desacetyl-2-hydroxyethyl bacteriochlorophyllide A dehydrogenase
MRQVMLEQPGLFVLRHAAEPEPRADEAVVRVERVGVCGTDLHAFAGRQPFFTYPRVLGHELAVTVEHVPAGESRVQVGDACTVRPFLNNPHSRATRRGRPNCCEDLRVLGVHIDGGMTDRLALQPEFLLPASDIELDVLALVEPLTIGCHAVARVALTSDDDVLVIGAGPIGLAVLQFAALDAGRVTVVDLSPRRLDFVRALFRDDRVHVAAAATEPSAGLGARFDVVFDATGSAASMMQAFDYVAAGGRLVFVGLTLDPLSFSDPDFHRREITLLASRNATPADFTRVLATIRSGVARPDAWITHRLALDEVPDRFAQVKSDPTLIKAIVTL